MSSIPGLRKKLKSVRAAGKLSKAMKTVSAAKFSRLSALYQNFSQYAAQYRELLLREDDAGENKKTAGITVVLGSNKGFCGGFNDGILSYLGENPPAGGENSHLIVCGEELARLLRENGFVPERMFVFSDVPSFAESDGLWDALSELAGEETDVPVRLVRPFFHNTMTQIPGEEFLTLHPSSGASLPEDVLCFPDSETVEKALAEKGFRTLLYGAVLETALGAQAATLMTMRSAYDTASEYSEELEGEIHRQRQRAVTADVIETASERGSKGEEANG